MKRSLIMITVFGLMSHLYAEDVMKKTMTHSQMTFKEKNLLKRQLLFQNKLQAWKKHKKNLILKFEEREDMQTNLGENNYYGKLRAKQYKEDFYTSLKSQDDAIAQNLSSISHALKKLKKFSTVISQSD